MVAPPPVPALPDTPRITPYAIVAQTGPFDVGFALYGDGTDYQNWLEVWLDGVLLVGVTDWTLASATGALGTIPRPITDAKVTLTSARTGTLQIVGARRPRRTSQFAENAGVTARNENVTYADIIAMQRERWELTQRLLRAPPGETLSTLPPASLRANLALMFNNVGDAIAAAFAAPGAAISAAMLPVVQAATLALARAALGLGTMATQNANLVAITGGTIAGLSAPIAAPSGGTGSASYGPIDGTSATKTISYSVVNGDKRQTHALNGAFTVTMGAASGFDTDFQIRLVNIGSGGCLLAISGLTSFFLYAEQHVVVQRIGSAWVVTPRTQRWKPSSGSGQFYVHPTLGSDANDGTSTGAGRALATVQEGVNRIYANVDGSGGVNLADGTHNVGTGILCVLLSPPGSNQITITGNASVPTACVISCSAGSSCLSVQDGAIVTITGVYFNTAGSGSNAVTGRQKAVVDIVNCDFGPFPSGIHASCTTWSSVNFVSGYTIWGNASTHVSCANNGYVNFGAFTINIPSPLAFVVFLSATNCGVISNGGVPMNFIGAGYLGTTGQRFSIANNAVAVIGVTLPGNAAGATSTGGIYQ